MSTFIKSFLGTLLALFLFAVALACMGLMLFVGLAFSGASARESLSGGSYLVFKLDTNISDAPAQMDLASLGGGNKDNLQLRSVVRALEAAAKDERISGVLITGNFEPSGYGTGFAALREVRGALTKFREAGKPVKAFLDNATVREYYVASAANEITMDPYGVLLMPGMAAQPIFYKGVFEKFGVGVQVTRVGKYKSAVEPFIREDLSAENREQLSMLLGDVWSSVLEDIGHSRSVSKSRIQRIVDDEALIRPERAKEAKLIDRVAYRDQLITELKKITHQTDPKESFHQISIQAYAESYAEEVLAKSNTSSGKAGHIALVYAEGEIVDGEGAHGSVGGDKLARELRKLRQDPEVKAIVLRVNSPGGSASASEHIQRELRLAKNAKPVVVSMGSYAASGGYWIAAYGDRIFAERATITGSIGVFGVFFDIEKLAHNLGFTFDRVKTGEMADVLTITRPKTPKELGRAQELVDWIYGEFVGKVADARKLDKKVVEEIAQGRVWSGVEAKKLGLVDEIGGLEAAVQFAAKKAGLGANPEIEEYPKKKDFSQLLAELMDDFQTRASHDNTLTGKVSALVEKELKVFGSFNDPKGVYARLPVAIDIR